MQNNVLKTITSWILAPLAFGVALAASSGAVAADAPAASGPRVVEIVASDPMKYNISAITAKPGEELKVVLSNTSALPKEAMGHNWVLLKMGSDPQAFSMAATSAKDTNYIPPSLKDEIVAHIELLGPGEKGEVVFKAPMAPGDYPFLCSFPAHFLVGMKGILTVK